MDFVLTLHSHLPYVLNHGRWPHGSDWICEAAIDTYLPLLLALDELQQEQVAAPITIGITPVLANQLASPVYNEEQELYFAQKLKTCAEAEQSLTETGDLHLLPLAKHWHQHLDRLLAKFRAEGGNLSAAFRKHADAGRIELISSGATHGFLPLLGRDESIRLQLQLGYAEHQRIFGRKPQGLWLPECAYRPRGMWQPLPDARARERAGLERFVEEAGFRYFFVDSHLANAGHAFTLYGAAGEEVEGGPTVRSPYSAYTVAGDRGPTPISAFIRDPVASRQVWSKQEGYPGDEWYLEFHKIRWPGGLKYWRVSAPGSDLGAKEPYNPAMAHERAVGHGLHFASLLERIATDPARKTDENLVSVPFDTELFGHWWHEGVDFLTQIYRSLSEQKHVTPTTASAHLKALPPTTGIHLSQGSWGANGDFSMWLNSETAWTWPRLWAIEEAFWAIAPSAISDPKRQQVLAQACRSMLLAMSSDWQFIISTGAVTDYAIKRFTEHCDDAEFLLAALQPDSLDLKHAHNQAAEMWERDHVFPDVLETVRRVLG
jgi:1,4-alpha-glucan branching enzyme